jgi:hypothetical protein
LKWTPGQIAELTLPQLVKILCPEEEPTEDYMAVIKRWQEEWRKKSGIP